MGLRDAKDAEIFEAARNANAIIISKDSDFLDLIGKFGSPPKLICLRCGNTTNQRLREIFGVHLQNAIHKLSNGESVIEIE
jgi:predicted nuclease of predicted toxin-antitoxin system